MQKIFLCRITRRITLFLQIAFVSKEARSKSQSFLNTKRVTDCVRHVRVMCICNVCDVTCTCNMLVRQAAL